MPKSLASVGVLALTTASAAAQEADPDHDDGLTLYRAFVGDQSAPRVTALDLSDPECRWTFETTGPARLYEVDGGAAVAAVQTDADAAHFFRSGVALHDHGDHSDMEVTEPATLEAALTGARLVHLVDHDGHVAIDFDRGGYVEIVDGHGLTHGALESTRLPQARAHHGFAAPAGAHRVTSAASDAEVEEGASIPRLGLQQVSEDGTPIGDVATCTGIHGGAFSGAYPAAGCREGVLTVTAGADGPVIAMLEYPAELPAGRTTGSLLGSTGIQMFLGNYGPDGLMGIDPAGAPYFR
jgi:zinc transport system substrate-binding protein